MPSRSALLPTGRPVGRTALATLTTLLTSVLALLAWNGGPADAATQAPAIKQGAAFYRVPRPLTAGPPGSIIRSQAMPIGAGLPNGARAYRILYRSQSITGSDVAVSGMVVVPGEAPPPGGYPIVSWAHGTSGMASACAPSRGGTDSLPYLAQFLREGDVVAASDYQGLGTSGVDPYLVGQSEAQTVLDAARAARDLLRSRVSNQVVVFGHSQGGQAALFAGQIAPTYTPELFVAGVVAVAPVSNVDEFVPAKVKNAPDPLAVFTVGSLYNWAKIYDDLSLSKVLTPRAMAMSSTFSTECISPLAAEFGAVATDRLFRPGWENTTTVRLHEAQNQSGSAPTTAPILVVQGRQDQLVPYAETTALVNNRLCRADGDLVEYDAVRHAAHSNVLTRAEPAVLRWIRARLARGGVTPTAPDSCRP